MFRRTTLLLTALLSLACFNVQAHEGHDHDEESLNEKQVKQLAAKTLPALIQAKKVDASWAKAQQGDVTVREVAGQDIWVVAYRGEAKAGEPLYLIFDGLGNFLEANKSGKLAKE